MTAELVKKYFACSETRFVIDFTGIRRQYLTWVRLNQLITPFLVPLKILLNRIHQLKSASPKWPLPLSVFDLCFVYTRISNLFFACCIICLSLPLYVQHSLETGFVISKEDLASVDTTIVMCKAHRNLGILRFSFNIGMCICHIRGSVSRCPT